MRIDLRSDTVTQPTQEMLSYMFAAAVGDDVYHEDPTVNALEEKVAALFGMQKALFFPSGTMANQAAIKLHTQPGDQLIADSQSHIFNYESGGAAFHSGVSCLLPQGDCGRITADQVSQSLHPPNFYHSPISRLVVLENTTNRGGGACYDFSEILKIKAVCRSHGLQLHLDGARLWNALIAKNETAAQYGRVFDTISVCLSKGLGAPVGSVLIGNAETMSRAIRVRKLFGGAMRQIGHLAAAGMYALENHFGRLIEDHTKAKEIAECLQSLPFVTQVNPVETNIVIFSITGDQDKFIQTFAAQNIHFYALGPGKLRLVTHLGYTNRMHACFLDTLRKMTSNHVVMQ